MFTHLKWCFQTSMVLCFTCKILYIFTCKVYVCKWRFTSFVKDKHPLVSCHWAIGGLAKHLKFRRFIIKKIIHLCTKCYALFIHMFIKKSGSCVKIYLKNNPGPTLVPCGFQNSGQSWSKPYMPTTNHTSTRSSHGSFGLARPHCTLNPSPVSSSKLLCGAFSWWNPGDVFSFFKRGTRTDRLFPKDFWDLLKLDFLQRLGYNSD